MCSKNPRSLLKTIRDVDITRPNDPWGDTTLGYMATQYVKLTTCRRSLNRQKPTRKMRIWERDYFGEPDLITVSETYKP
jgi:hypothetical protein